METPEAFLTAAFYCPINAQCWLNAHTLMYSHAPITHRNMASDMINHINDYAKLYLCIRWGGAEGAELTVWIRRQLQA